MQRGRPAGGQEEGLVPAGREEPEESRLRLLQPCRQEGEGAFLPGHGEGLQHWRAGELLGPGQEAAAWARAAFRGRSPSRHERFVPARKPQLPAGLLRASLQGAAGGPPRSPRGERRRRPTAEQGGKAGRLVGWGPWKTPHETGEPSYTELGGAAGRGGEEEEEGGETVVRQR